MRNQVKTFFQVHKKRISPMLFLGGFVFDLFTLTQVDLLFDNMILLGHLLIISFSILLIHLGKRDQVFSNFTERLMLIAPYTLVFSFGGVLSGYVIFYTKSASLIASWPFLLGLYLLFLTSEFVFHRFQQSLFQLGMWFAATVSFCIFFVPTMLRIIGPWVFILSIFISLIIGKFYVELITRAYKPLRKRKASILSLFFIISSGFIYLYFANLVPPIPLSMKETDVYHDIRRNSENQLVAQTQKRDWLENLSPIKDIEIKTGDPLFTYSSVYSPAGINTQIKHIWEYQDGDVWKEFNTVIYQLNGGRTDGFRWYSFATPFPGRWQVRTTTIHGQEIGRVIFDVTNVLNSPELVTEVLK